MKIRHSDPAPERDFVRIPNDVLSDTRLTPEARLLWCFLRRCADGWGTDRERLAKSLGVSVYVVRTRLTELAEHDYIKSDETRTSDGTYVYTLTTLVPMAENRPTATGGGESTSGKERLSRRPTGGGKSASGATGGRSTASGQSTSIKKTSPKKTKNSKIKNEKTEKSIRTDGGKPTTGSAEASTRNSKKVLKLVRNSDRGMFTSQIASSLGKASIELIDELRQMESLGTLNNVANKGMAERWKEAS